MKNLNKLSYDFDFFKVLNKPGYGWVVKSLPSVVVLPIRINSNFDSKKVCDIDLGLIQIYRVPLNIKAWEIPGGGIENKETYIQAAKRELFEETGIKAKKVEKIGSFYEAPGRMYFPHHVLVATKLSFFKKNNRFNEEESIQNFKFFKINQIDDMISRKKIVSGPTITAIKLFSEWYKKLLD